jgi:AbrB family looped-hinge helix DNA binding protein
LNNTTISSKFQLVIPREIRERFNLKPGQKVVFIPYKKSVRLVIVPSIKEAFGMLKDLDAEILRVEDKQL